MDRPPRPYNVRGKANPSSQELPNAEEGLEYGCNYCPMAFSTKQAVGGHQNAHKLQRAMEKTARERANSHFGYYPGLYPAPHNRSQDLVRRMHLGYDVGPRMPLPGNPYGMGWAVPGPINTSSQAPGQGPLFVQSHDMNPRLSRNGQGGSGSRPVYPDLSVFAAPRDLPVEGSGEEQGEDDSGLDLSLKL